MIENVSDGLDTSVAAAVDGDPKAIGRVLESIRPLVVRYCRARVGRQERSFASADDVAQEVCLAVLTALPSYRDQGRPFLAFVYGIAAHKVADAHRAAARNRTEPLPDVPDIPDIAPTPEELALTADNRRRAGIRSDVKLDMRAIHRLVDRTSLGTPSAMKSRLRWAQHQLGSRAAGLVGAALNDIDMSHHLSPNDAQPSLEVQAMRNELSPRAHHLLDILSPKQREIVILRIVGGMSAEETAEAVGTTPGAVRLEQHRALTRLRESAVAKEAAGFG